MTAYALLRFIHVASDFSFCVSRSAVVRLIMDRAGIIDALLTIASGMYITLKRNCRRLNRRCVDRPNFMTFAMRAAETLRTVKIEIALTSR